MLLSSVKRGYSQGVRLVARALVIGASVLAFAGCGSAPDASGVTVAVNGSVSVDANNLIARVIGDGSTFSLNAAVAQKPVALWFWAPG